MSALTPVPASSRPSVILALRWLLFALVFAPALAAQTGDQARPKEEDRRAQEAARAAEAARRAAQDAARRAAEVAAQRAVVERQVLMLQQGRQAWPDEQFERWVFSQDQTADRARKKYEALLTSQVEELERNCELTLTQMRKLTLMGRGDIKRLFDGYEKAKTRFNAMDNDVNRLQEIQPDLAAVQQAQYGGPFQEGSLLAKSVRTTLTDEQFARYDAITRERRAFRHRATVEMVVSMLEQSMPLRDAQRRELVALLEKETKPLRRTGQYAPYALCYQISRLPDAKFKNLLTDTQRLVFERQLAQYAALVPNLRQNGQILDEDLGDGPLPPPPPPVRRVVVPGVAVPALAK